MVGNTTVVQAHYAGRKVGRADITFNPDTGDVVDRLDARSPSGPRTRSTRPIKASSTATRATPPTRR